MKKKEEDNIVLQFQWIICNSNLPSLPKVPKLSSIHKKSFSAFMKLLLFLNILFLLAISSQVGFF